MDGSSGFFRCCRTSSLFQLPALIDCQGPYLALRNQRTRPVKWTDGLMHLTRLPLGLKLSGSSSQQRQQVQVGRRNKEGRKREPSVRVQNLSQDGRVPSQVPAVFTICLAS
jgi:hypothetical protein